MMNENGLCNVSIFAHFSCLSITKSVKQKVLSIGLYLSILLYFKFQYKFCFCIKYKRTVRFLELKKCLTLFKTIILMVSLYNFARKKKLVKILHFNVNIWRTKFTCTHWKRKNISWKLIRSYINAFFSSSVWCEFNLLIIFATMIYREKRTMVHIH